MAAWIGLCQEEVLERFTKLASSLTVNFPGIKVNPICPVNFCVREFTWTSEKVYLKKKNYFVSIHVVLFTQIPFSVYKKLPEMEKL